MSDGTHCEAKAQSVPDEAQSGTNVQVHMDRLRWLMSLRASKPGTPGVDQHNESEEHRGSKAWVLCPGKDYPGLEHGVVYQTTRELNTDGEVNLKLPNGGTLESVKTDQYLQQLPLESAESLLLQGAQGVFIDLIGSPDASDKLLAVNEAWPFLQKHFPDSDLGSLKVPFRSLATSEASVMREWSVSADPAMKEAALTVMSVTEPEDHVDWLTELVADDDVNVRLLAVTDVVPCLISQYSTNSVAPEQAAAWRRSNRKSFKARARKRHQRNKLKGTLYQGRRNHEVSLVPEVLALPLRELTPDVLEWSKSDDQNKTAAADEIIKLSTADDLKEWFSFELSMSDMSQKLTFVNKVWPLMQEHFPDPDLDAMKTLFGTLATPEDSAMQEWSTSKELDMKKATKTVLSMTEPEDHVGWLTALVKHKDATLRLSAVTNAVPHLIDEYNTATGAPWPAGDMLNADSAGSDAGCTRGRLPDALAAPLSHLFDADVPQWVRLAGKKIKAACDVMLLCNAVDLAPKVAPVLIQLIKDDNLQVGMSMLKFLPTMQEVFSDADYSPLREKVWDAIADPGWTPESAKAHNLWSKSATLFIAGVLSVTDADLRAFSGKYFPPVLNERNFVPTGDRWVLPRLKAHFKSPKASDNRKEHRDLRDVVRRFLEIQVELSNGRGQELAEIVEATESVHRSAFKEVLKSMYGETGWEPLSERMKPLVTRLQGRHGERPVQTTSIIEDLYNRAGRLHVRHMKFMTAVKKQAGADLLDAGQKSIIRVEDKRLLNPNPDARKNYNDVCDLERTGLKCKDSAKLEYLLQILQSCDKEEAEHTEVHNTILGADVEAITLVRAKDRYGEPNSSYYADLMLNYRFDDDEDEFLMEVQLMHDDLANIRQNGSHGHYNKTRTAREMLERLREEHLIPKIDVDLRSLKRANSIALRGPAAEKVEKLQAKVVGQTMKLQTLQQQVDSLEQSDAAKSEQIAAQAKKIQAIEAMMRRVLRLPQGPGVLVATDEAGGGGIIIDGHHHSSDEEI